MSDLTLSTAEQRRGPSPGLISLGRSLLINLLAPYLLYRLVQGWFAPKSAAPLLICALIPAVELAVVFVRRRRIDTIAVISLVQLAVSIAIGLAAGSMLAAMIGHALQPAAFGLVFGVSLLMGRPLIRALARQTMAGDDPQRQADFDARTATAGARRVFARLTAMWTAALGLESVVRVAAALTLPTPTYLLLGNTIGYGVIALLTWLSIRIGRRASEQARAAG